jgi:hypothetical protein
MKVNRRNFLRYTGLITATLLIASELWFCTPSSKTEEKSSDLTATSSILAEHSVEEFGIQLWPVNEGMAKDPRGVLGSLASYGYRQIESIEVDKDVFWGMNPKEFKT